MIVPVKNIVEQVDLTAEDVLLPLLECVINSLISLNQSKTPINERKIRIEITRGIFPKKPTLENLQTISSYKIIDNGVGFNEKHYQSFETPFTQINKKFGCKGVGRFTVLAAFKEYIVVSNYKEGDIWYERIFRFTKDKEIELISLKESSKKEHETIIEIKNCNNPIIIENSALSIHQIAEAIMQHCLIYYLNENLPTIEIADIENEKYEVINDLFKKVSKEKEREFFLDEIKFKLYITKTVKEGNRKNNYLYYCANSRTVGHGRNLKNINSIFTYPTTINGSSYFFDIYLVSDYLNRKVFKTRNGFDIPKDSEYLEQNQFLFNGSRLVTFSDIEKQVSEILENEYESFVRESKEKSKNEVINYISKNPRYNSFLHNPDIINSVPPNLPEEKLEEYLYKISFTVRKNLEQNIEKFIKNKHINEDAINHIIEDIKKKTAYDVDSLADYMTRRKAIISLFDKFLDADEKDEYKLEEDIHRLIFPLGLTNNDLGYENHNLWLLDERFITYKFIASDKSITSFSQVNSRKEPDLVMIDNPQMFQNPICFGDKNSGRINSLVIFEFKRPGEIAHQKNKTDFQWQFSDLIEPYFDQFLYGKTKKNYKGNPVFVELTTPKFGFVILDDIPSELIRYNQNKGWQLTPFGTYFYIQPQINLHIEVMSFRRLLEFATERHTPFFDRLFNASST